MLLYHIRTENVNIQSQNNLFLYDILQFLNGFAVRCGSAENASESVLSAIFLSDIDSFLYMWYNNKE